METIFKKSKLWSIDRKGCLTLLYILLWIILIVLYLTFFARIPQTL